MLSCYFADTGHTNQTILILCLIPKILSMSLLMQETNLNLFLSPDDNFGKKSGHVVAKQSHIEI